MPEFSQEAITPMGTEHPSDRLAIEKLGKQIYTVVKLFSCVNI